MFHTIEYPLYDGFSTVFGEDVPSPVVEPVSSEVVVGHFLKMSATQLGRELLGLDVGWIPQKEPARMKPGKMPWKTSSIFE